MAKAENTKNRAQPLEPEDPEVRVPRISPHGRGSELRQHHAAARAAHGSTSAGSDLATNVVALLDVAVPAFCDWCVVDVADPKSGLLRYAMRYGGCEHPGHDGLIDGCGADRLSERIPQLQAITDRVLASGQSEVWPNKGTELPTCIVVAMGVNDLPFATVTFVGDDGHPGYQPSDISAAEEVVWTTATAVERYLLHQSAREAVRHTQRIASQLHQLIATSITVAGLRSEQEILMSLASSTRSVFDADLAIVTLEEGPSAPLRGESHRGKQPVCVVPDDSPGPEQFPSSATASSVPWRENDWLVAPVFERRDRARGVVAIRRQSTSEFATEDREVLTLLAQMASTALGAAELSRTIQHSETRWRILVETAPVGIVETDIEGSVRWWNRGAARIFAWPEFADSLGGDGPLFPEDAAEQLHALWTDVVVGAFASGRDLGGIDIRGRRRDLTASAALLPSGDGEARSILTLIDDVTDHRELKSELRHAHQMEIRGQVASSVAHDFNNLLTLISGYAEILSTDLAGEDRASQMVKDIQATAARASLLTEQLQAIGRTKEPTPVVLSPEVAIRSIGEVLERIVGVDVELVWSLEHNSHNIRVDADLFEQMILNLALNARDAMPAGGQLSIAVDWRAIESEGALALNVAAGRYVLISVSDTGMGMDEETRLHCFEPLFTTKGPFKGTGLGLAAARRLVEDSQGSIRVRSEVGQGTTFEMYLPSVDESPGELLAPPSAAQPHGSATIVLAEDDEGLRRLVVQVLERNGYLVLEADSGELALELARDFEGPIDLLVSDVVMALITGDELARAMQAANPTLQVLLMSGSADDSILDSLLPATSAFLAKPFRPSELVEHVQNLLARRDALAQHPANFERR